MVGLGRMGGNMARRLIRGGHRVAGHDLEPALVRGLSKEGVEGAGSLGQLVAALKPPRVVWVMVPAGEPTESTIEQLATLLAAGDILVDGGNSYYRDSMRRSEVLAGRGIRFLDAGTSGGIWGLENGYCMMVGGPKDAFDVVEPLLQTLAPARDRGYVHAGPAGAGHFVKMVHNGIEYGLMEAYAEGFELLKAKKEFDLDLAGIAEVWRHGSVVRSWLLDLTAQAFKEDPQLAGAAPYVEDSGEGRWTVEESVRLAVPLPAISAALQVRFRSRQEAPFGPRLLASLRRQFGGHAVKKKA
jgi:6-phosphogluconate dehydrogenase